MARRPAGKRVGLTSKEAIGIVFEVVRKRLDRMRQHLEQQREHLDLLSERVDRRHAAAANVSPDWRKFFPDLEHVLMELDALLPEGIARGVARSVPQGCRYCVAGTEFCVNGLTSTECDMLSGTFLDHPCTPDDEGGPCSTR